MNAALSPRIAAFLEVRDMPFRASTHGEPDCCCSTKAYLLEAKLKTQGIQSRHVLCWFKWEALLLPQSVLAVPHETLPSHQFLEVLIPETNQWVLVDPTWDKELQSVLTISEWDGLGSTACAVPIERRCTPEETETIFKECADAAATARYFAEQGAFLQAVNRYFEEVRATASSS